MHAKRLNDRLPRRIQEEEMKGSKFRDASWSLWIYGVYNNVYPE